MIPLFSSSEVTGWGYPGLLDRKNRSNMCPRWESNPRLPTCKASTLSTRPGSPLAKFHRTDLGICSLSRDRKTLSYSQINMVHSLLGCAGQIFRLVWKQIYALIYCQDYSIHLVSQRLFLVNFEICANNFCYKENIYHALLCYIHETFC